MNPTKVTKAQMIEWLQARKAMIKELSAKVDINWNAALFLAVVVLRMANKALVASMINDGEKQTKMLKEINDYGYKSLKKVHMLEAAKAEKDRIERERKAKQQEDAVVKTEVVE